MALSVAFFWSGAKSDLAFLVLAVLLVPAMVAGLRTYQSRAPMRPWIWGFTLWLSLSWANSLDRSASLMSTSRWLFFALFLILFPAPFAKWLQSSFFLNVLRLLGALTLARTAYQYAVGQWATAFGFLPINPTANAVWMSSLGCWLLGTLLTRGMASPRGWSRGDRLDAVLATGLVIAALAGPSRVVLIALSCGIAWACRSLLTWRRCLYGGFAAATLLLVAVPTSWIYNRLRLNEGNYRLEIWGTALQAVRDRPWFGWGADNFEMAYQRYAFPVETDRIRFARTTRFAHNEYLQVAVGNGVPAAFLFAGFWFLTMRRAWLGSNHGVGGGLVVVAVAAFYTHIWHYPILLFWSLLLALRVEPPRTVLQAGLVASGIRGATVSLLVIVMAGLLWNAIREQWAHHGNWGRIVRVNPFDSDAWEQLGMNVPIPAEAIVFLERAVSASSENPYYREQLARALELSSRPDDLREAASHYAAATRLAPSRAINFLGLARLAYRQGLYTEAIRYAEHARTLEPHYWESDEWIARSFEALGQPRSAASTRRAAQHRLRTYESRQQQLIDAGAIQAEPASYEAVILATQ